MGAVAIYVAVAALSTAAVLWLIWMWAEARLPVIETVDLRFCAKNAAAAAADAGTVNVDMNGNRSADGGGDGDRNGSGNENSSVNGDGNRSADGGGDGDRNGSGNGSMSATRVVLLTDAHIKTRAAGVRRVALLAAKAAPDALLLAGDYIDSVDDIPRFKAWLGYISRTLDAYDYNADATAPLAINEIRRSIPIYMCLGNHDMRAFRRDSSARPKFERAMEELGVVILDGMSTALFANGATYAITGYKDGRAALSFNGVNGGGSRRRNGSGSRRQNGGGAAIPDAKSQKEARNARRGSPANPRFTLGLAHNPDHALALASIRPRHRPDALLCGHFHGGQIRLPFNFEFACLRRERICRDGVRSGLYAVSARSRSPVTPLAAFVTAAQKASNSFPSTSSASSSASSSVSSSAESSIRGEPLYLYVSRGIGCVLIPLRFMSRPEVTLLLLP